MNFDISCLSFNCNGKPGGPKQQAIYAIDKNRIFISLFLFSAIIQFSGCVSDNVDDQSVLKSYQQALADQGPQQRLDTEGRNPNQPLGLLKPID